VILADSSALIEYYRRHGAREVQQAVAEAIDRDELAVNGIIYVEVVGFAASERELQALIEDFRAFHRLPLDDGDFELAATLGFDLRRRGRTVPATDLIIAANAIRAQAEILHVDDHFEEIAKVSSLSCRKVGTYQA
jgi:predicted nucleic acid-binding protein